MDSQALISPLPSASLSPSLLRLLGSVVFQKPSGPAACSLHMPGSVMDPDGWRAVLCPVVLTLVALSLELAYL